MQRRMLAPSLAATATSLVAPSRRGTFPAAAMPLAVSAGSTVSTPAAGSSRVLHLSVYGNHLAHHYHDAIRAGDFRLGIRTIGWDRQGWPYLSTQPDPSPTS